jgi:NDP-sugar pyrophosphorylase family protein
LSSNSCEEGAVTAPEASGVLFSAGRGARLKPLTESVPKAILPVLDVPLGSWGLTQLLSICPRVFVNVEPNVRAMVESQLAPVTEGQPGAVTFKEEFPEPFGAAGTLVALRDLVTEKVVTWNADTITDLALQPFFETHKASGASVTIAILPVDRAADVSFDSGRATAFIDRHARPEASGGQFIGVAMLERTELEALPLRRPLGLAEAVLEPLVRKGDLAVHVHAGYAIDVGTSSRYLQASIDLLEGRGPAPPLPPPGEIIPLDDGIAYLGPGASAADGSLAAGAMLLRGSRVLEGAVVERALVWQETVVPSGARVNNAVWW